MYSNNNGLKVEDKNSNVNSGVAIVGVGFRMPGDSNDPSSFWENLINGFDAQVDLTERWSDNFTINGDIKSNQAALISLDEIKNFDSLFFSISQAEHIDPQQRLLLKCTWEALEDAHVDPIKLRGSYTSVYVGISTFDYLSIMRNKEETLPNVFGSSFHSASNRISYCFDFRGPSISIDSACSSSLNACDLGYQSIISGKCKYSIIGGASLLFDAVFCKAFSYLNMLGKGGKCKSFDADADGYARGEGVGVVVLKNLQDAINDGDRIYCVINGINSNADGNFDKNNFYSPSKTGQYENIKEMFKKCSSLIHPSQIDYCEAHGTGTPTGDPIECEGISMAFSKYHSSDNPLLIGSVKSNIGHLEACSGIASIIKCCLMFKHRQFVPSINFNTPNPLIKFQDWYLKVVTQVTPFPTNKLVSMMINNFGITSSNVCMVLTEFNNNQSQQQHSNDLVYEKVNDKQYLIPVSANSKNSLNNYISTILNEYNSYSDGCEFFDFVQYQILSKSTQLYQRALIMGSRWLDIKNSERIIKTTSSITSNIKSSSSSSSDNSDSSIVFVFSGQGTQYLGASKQLYKNDSYFKNIIDIMDEKLFKYFGYSIKDKVWSINSSSNGRNENSINEPILAQPLIVMIQVGLYETLSNQWNVKPKFIVGHSLGELSAQYCSGSISLDTLCYILYYRSLAQQKTIGSGRMLSINISPEEYNENYSNDYPTLEISCYNSPSSIVVSGNESILKSLEEKLKKDDIHTTLLSTPSSFHTSSQDQIKNDFLELEFTSNPPLIPVLSTVYKDFFNGDSIKFTPEYCFRNARDPVYFTQTINRLYQHIQDNQLGSKVIFIELSPHSALSYYLKQMKPIDLKYFKQQIDILSTLNKNKNDNNQIFNLISTLYCNHQISINFKNQLLNHHHHHQNKNQDNHHRHNSNYKVKELKLPRYQWDDKEYFKEDSNYKQFKNDGPPIEILGNKNNNVPFISYKTNINIEKPHFQYFKGHQVKNKIYFPGTGYIENIISCFSNQDIIINSLEFKSPLILFEGTPKQLQTNISQLSKRDYRVQFHYYEPNSNKWVQTSTGNIQLFNFRNSKEKKMDIQLIKSLCNLTTVSGKEFYNHVKSKSGLSYSGHFQSVKECYVGNNCTLNKIQLNKTTSYSSGNGKIETIMNCAVLDSCLHGVMVFLQDSCSIVFEKIENFKLYNSNLPSMVNSGDELYAYIEYKGRKGDTFESKTTIMLNDGTIVIEIDKAFLRSLTPVIDSLQIQYPTSEEFQLVYLQLKDCQIKTNFNQLLLNQKEKEEPSTLVCELVYQSLKPLVSIKNVIRLIEFNSGSSDSGSEEWLADIILKRINMLQDENYSNNNINEIEIEYTLSIKSSTIKEMKDKLLYNGISIIFKHIDIQDGDLNQKLKSNYYDLVLISNSSYGSGDSSSNSLNEVYRIIKSNGYLLMVQNELIVSKDIWSKLLKESHFGDIQFSDCSDNGSYLAHSQKEDIQIYSSNSSNNDIIVYGNSGESIFKDQLNQNHIKYQDINTMDEIKQVEIKENSIIYFIKSIDQLTVNNFKQVSLEYIQIAQHLIKNNLALCKLILITTNCYSESSSNYLASSITGAFKYFIDELQHLEFYSFDFDSTSLPTLYKFINKIINSISSNNNNNQHQHQHHNSIDNNNNNNNNIKEYIIRNNQIYIEKFKYENNIYQKYKSNSIEDQNQNNSNSLYSKLNDNLEFQLKSKQDELGKDQVEVEVKAIGINYKDYLVYAGLISSDSIDNSFQCGIEYSGIIKKIGSDVGNFKVGDRVYAMGHSTSSSSIIVNKNHLCIMPQNITFSQAASIPAVYLTSYHCLFKIGNFDIDEQESILIHSASGGVGLSIIEILKWKSHKGHIFTTVGSEAKANYLRDTYGSFITGIYSTRNKDYVQQIKEKQKELNSKKIGVDLIINTLSSDYIESNFQVLAPTGRHIDLSITHLNSNEYIDYGKFKFNFSYANVEMLLLDFNYLSKLLRIISGAIESGQLSLIPIKEYSVLHIKEAIEFINERKHIGKIVVNYEGLNITNHLINNTIQKEYQLPILKSNYNISTDNLGDTILLTGQTGIVFEIIRWITRYSKSVKNVIILSKSKLKWELEKLINSNLNNGIKFYFKSVDIENYNQVETNINEIFKENNQINSINSIFHFAFAFTTCELLDISMDHLNQSHGAKTIGAINLHNLSLKYNWDIKNFILASSISTVLGNFNQCSYISANNVLESLAKFRRSLGLPALTIGWGHIGSGVGVAARNDGVAEFLNGEGLDTITSNLVLGSLDLLIQNSNRLKKDYDTLIISRIDYDRLDFSSMYNHKLDYKRNSLDLDIDQNENSNKIKNKSETITKVLAKISELLSVNEENINMTLKMSEYGVDSIVMVQVKNWVDKEFKKNLFSISELQNQSIESIINKLNI